MTQYRHLSRGFYSSTELISYFSLLFCNCGELHIYLPFEVKTILHSWNKLHFLVLSCSYIAEFDSINDFCVHVYEDFSVSFSFLVKSLLGFSSVRLAI